MIEFLGFWWRCYNSKLSSYKRASFEPSLYTYLNLVHADTYISLSFIKTINIKCLFDWCPHSSHYGNCIFVEFFCAWYIHRKLSNNNNNMKQFMFSLIIDLFLCLFFLQFWRKKTTTKTKVYWNLTKNFAKYRKFNNNKTKAL